MRTPSVLLLSTWLLFGCSDGDDAGAPAAPDSGSPPTGATGTEATPPSTPGGAWLVEVTDAWGLDFVQVSGATGKLLMPEIMGGGAALFDYDGDGDLDAYLVNGGPNVEDPRRKDGAPNRLYRNEAGARFTDVTATTGAQGTSYGMGCAVGDIDNDGHPDVYLSNYGPDELLRNVGGESFSTVGRSSGLDAPGWCSSVGLLDFDRDGDLDIYVARYVRFLADKKCFGQADQHEYCGPRAFAPMSDVLLRNEGNLTFQDVSESRGITAVEAAGLGVTCDDFDDDGTLDIYVTNDGYANTLWVEDGEGGFVDDALILGVALNMEGKWEAGMGVVSADFNADGFTDLFMTHMTRETNTLYRNLGNGSGFIDATGSSGLARSSVALTGFGTSAVDLDLDGLLDLLVVNGRVERSELLPGTKLPSPWDVYAEPNLLYRNTGAGNFVLANELAPQFCDTVEISRGLAVGDIDGDGDLDALMTNIGGPARLYRNDAPRAGHWLLVEAIDPRYERVAFGAGLRLTIGDRVLLHRVGSGSSYQSASDLRAHFGVPKELAGERAKARLDVRWLDGLEETFEVPAFDTVLRIERGRGRKSDE